MCEESFAYPLWSPAARDGRRGGWLGGLSKQPEDPPSPAISPRYLVISCGIAECLTLTQTSQGKSESMEIGSLWLESIRAKIRAPRGSRPAHVFYEAIFSASYVRRQTYRRLTALHHGGRRASCGNGVFLESSERTFFKALIVVIPDVVYQPNTYL